MLSQTLIGLGIQTILVFPAGAPTRQAYRQAHMDLQESQTAVRHGAYAGFIVAAFTALVVAVGMLSEDDSPYARWDHLWCVVDVALIVAMTFGVWIRSRFAASCLVLYFIASRLVLNSEDVSLNALPLLLILLFLLAKGAFGAFAYHRRQREENPLYRPVKRWTWFVGVSFFLLAAGFIAAIVALDVLGPPTFAVTGDDLGHKNREALRAEGILNDGEVVIFFYTTSIISVTEEGNVVTNQRVISYEMTDDGMWLDSASYDEIADVSLEVEGDTFTDATIAVTKSDGEAFYLYAPAVLEGVERFMREMRERIIQERQKAPGADHVAA